MRLVRPALVLSFLLLGCASQPAPPQRSPWDAPPLEQCVSILDGRSGARLSLAELLDRLAEADVVFLGETHLDETTHRVELAAYKGLLARRPGRVVLALEMFERDVQPTLDAYLAGAIDEQAFLSAARPWSNYRTAYRPLIELAKALSMPVVASNFPAPLRRRVAEDGAPALDALQGEERRQAPAELLANTPAYWRRVDNAVRGHIGMMGGPAAPDDPRLTDTQTLWDNSMGESCARALDEHPGALVLHVNGGFHSQYWEGTVRQLRLRKPEATVLTVGIVPAANPGSETVSGAPQADYVVLAEARARDVEDGKWAVHVSRELRYRLHVPDAAWQGEPVPLLIWLSDDGCTADDGLALWMGRLGAECAIAVLEAPYRETQEDLVEGGRWFWPDTFTEDLDPLRESIERSWGYILRHYPVDGRRVVLAGEGTGATVVATVSLLTERIAHRAVALSPRRYAKIKDFPLPLPEARGDAPPPEKSLRVVIEPGDEAWWASELAAYADIGFDAAAVAGTQDAWQVELQREDELRAALGLAPCAPTPEQVRRLHIVAEGRRARVWARLLALSRSASDVQVAVLEREPADAGSTPIELALDAAAFAAGAPLPRCPGAFGGTTLLVLPDSLSQQELDGWIALEASDPIQAASRFHRLRVASGSGARSLQAQLSQLLAENRRSVLIVPATFYAGVVTMRALQLSVRDLEDRMTIYWRPGLGGLDAAPDRR